MHDTPRTDRRRLLQSAGLAAFAIPAGAALANNAPAAAPPAWAKGFDGQRKADLGNDTYLNPILAGDHPDPTILKDGRDYYMTFSSFDAYPGLVIWHSTDLVNWQPLVAALTKNVGSVWAPELCKHNGRYFIYFPVRGEPRNTIYVVWADRITGPWSTPIDLDLTRNIDPGHAVDDAGVRWLFLNGGARVRLADDGLSCRGEPEHVYDAWHYPSEWDVESFSPEGPKITRHGRYYYLISAVGGTAGPPTGHMVIAARAASLAGPWEHHPNNPLVHTNSAAERWWSRGHATLVEGPSGDWWGVYHGYENGFWTLGRQTLLAPVRWTDDGWLEFGGGDLSQPIPKPHGGEAQVHGFALSDDFSTDKYGLQWSFANPSPRERDRISRRDGTLHLRAAGASPKDSSPLVFVVGDQAYELQCEIEVDHGTRAGLLLFYDPMLYCGVGFDDAHFVTHQYGGDRVRFDNTYGKRMFLRVRNDRHVVSFHTSGDGVTWERYNRGMEVSGYHHNVRGGFLMLKPGLYATGTGEARFRNLTYRAL